MLGYVHDFHAGNHADILKHCVLIELLRHLNRKDKPYTFFDTHAGAGLYNLSDARAQKTGEAANGIERLLSCCKENADAVPQQLAAYLSLIAPYYRQGLYPGSPRIAADYLSAGSALILSELHPAAFATLRRTMQGARAALHHRNGWEMLNALTPPKIKRGGAFIDPSYELPADYPAAAETLSAVFRKWPAAILALWYPLLSYRSDLICGMKETIVREIRKCSASTEILEAELCVNAPDAHQETALADSIGSRTPRMYGSGMLIVNPPWKTAERLSAILPFLADCLSVDGRGGCGVHFR